MGIDDARSAEEEFFDPGGGDILREVHEGLRGVIRNQIKSVIAYL